MRSLTSARDHAFEVATSLGKAGADRARKVALGVDRSVHHRPWSYIAGSVLAGVLLGYALGRNRK